MANFVANLLLFYVTLFGLIFQGSDGVKDVHLEGPRYARRGEDLTLRCNYDLESDSLYAVKWYRGSEEFYRFIPKEAPPKQAFPISGVVVDVNKSDDHGVFIRNVSFETNGRFKCFVSAETTFQTITDAKDIEVVVIDYNSPRLSLDKMGYQPGEKGVANCSIEGTYPAPNITWFINAKQVHVSVSTKVVPVTEETLLRRGVYQTTPYYGYGGYGHAVTNTGGRNVVTTTEKNTDGRRRDYQGALGMEGTGRKLTSSVSSLVFPIEGYGQMTIKCTGQLYDVYNETSSIQIQPKPPSQYNSNRDAPGASTQKYGLPNQLHTMKNQTAFLANDATHLVHCSSLFTFTGVITLIITSTAAQFPKVSYLPLYERLVG